MENIDEDDSDSSENLDVQHDTDYTQERYLRVIRDFENNVAAEELLAEFMQLHEALIVHRDIKERLNETNSCLQNQLNAQSFAVKSSAQLVRQAQQASQQMKEDLDEANSRAKQHQVREQQAQELRIQSEKHIAELKKSIEGGRVDLDLKDLGALSHGQDQQRQERDRLIRENEEMRIVLQTTVSNYDEAEKKNMAAGARMDTMAQHLEILSSELGEEIKLRESLESKQQNHVEALQKKEETIAVLVHRVHVLEEQVERLEISESEKKLALEKLNKELEVTTARVQRSQRDLETQLLRIERLSREAGQKSALLKAREEVITRIKQDTMRSVKTHEVHLKRMAVLDAARQDVERERDELKAVVAEREREVERFRKQAECLKKRLDELLREKELQAKNLTKALSVAEEQNIKAKQQEQVEKILRAQVEQQELEIVHKKKIAKKFERECDKLRSQNARRLSQGEAVCEQLRNKHEEAVRSRREVLETTFRHQHELALLDSVRTDKENSERNVVLLKAQVERLQEKLREVEHKSGQLKTSITAHEAFRMKDELALQRAVREKESARHELRQVRDQLTAFRERVAVAEEEQNKVKDDLSEAATKRTTLEASLAKFQAEHKEIQKQYQQKCEDVLSSKEKIKELELQYKSQQVHYDRQIDDIRLLKIEVKDLRQEKETLSFNLSTMVDARQEAFRLQRHLTAEQLKCKALEEEMARPRNVHRWRYLQGEDPKRFELVQKLALAQKRLINKSRSKSAPPRQVGRTEETQYTVSAETLFQIRTKAKQIKAVLAERGMLEAEVNTLQEDVHKLGQQLHDARRTIFAQKRQLQTGRARRQRLEQGGQQDIHIDAARIPAVTGASHCAVSGNKHARFAGGGFNLSRSPSDSRLPTA